MDRSDGISVLDGTAVGAVIFSLVGIILGSQWRMGPIAAATGGLLLGGLLGYIVDCLIPEKRLEQRELRLLPGLVLVQVSTTDSDRAKEAERLLRDGEAKQLTVLKEPLLTKTYRPQLMEVT